VLPLLHFWAQEAHLHCRHRSIAPACSFDFFDPAAPIFDDHDFFRDRDTPTPPCSSFLGCHRPCSTAAQQDAAFTSIASHGAQA
jgi:hypothetical protein